MSNHPLTVTEAGDVAFASLRAPNFRSLHTDDCTSGYQPKPLRQNQTTASGPGSSVHPGVSRFSGRWCLVLIRVTKDVPIQFFFFFFLSLSPCL